MSSWIFQAFKRKCCRFTSMLLLLPKILPLYHRRCFFYFQLQLNIYPREHLKAFSSFFFFFCTQLHQPLMPSLIYCWHQSFFSIPAHPAKTLNGLRWSRDDLAKACFVAATTFIPSSKGSEPSEAAMEEAPGQQTSCHVAPPLRGLAVRSCQRLWKTKKVLMRSNTRGWEWLHLCTAAHWSRHGQNPRGPKSGPGASLWAVNIAGKKK